VQGWIERHEAATCPPVVFELLRGVTGEAEAEEVRGYLFHLEVFPVDWIGAARWAAGPAVRSIRVKSMDLLIAHTAMAHAAVLVHEDSDFDRLARRTRLSVMRPGGATPGREGHSRTHGR
jgi:predicted nucleic acid-binding protein